MEKLLLEYDTNATTDLASVDFLPYDITNIQTVYMALPVNQGYRLQNPQTEYHYIVKPLHTPSSTLLKLYS